MSNETKERTKEMQGWQPIETVPHEGKFDVWAKTWSPKTDRFAGSRFTDCYWRKRDEMGQWQEGIVGVDSGFHPTHWMLIPDPPNQ